MAHPQSNGQAERANGLNLSGIKPQLVEPLQRAPGAWVEELPAVLWSLRTTPNRSTGFTPFFLVYGSEAIIPADVEFDSPRHALYTTAESKEAREDGVDLKEEACMLALSRSAIYQQKLWHYRSKKIRPSLFVRAIWCSAESRSRMVSINCPRLGKVLLSSAEHSRTTLTTSLIAPKALYTRTLQELKRSVPGMASFYARFTVEQHKCIHAIQQTISKAIMHLRKSV